jgi:hypothetical protein
MRLPSWRKEMPWLHIGAIVCVVVLMLADFRVAFHRNGGQPGSLAFSLTMSEARAGNSFSAFTGSRFVAVRSDVWNCYRLRENVNFNFGIITIPDRCQDNYMVVVQTETCQSAKTDTRECNPGTWRWVPNPPCGSDSPTGWWLPHC